MAPQLSRGWRGAAEAVAGDLDKGATLRDALERAGRYDAGTLALVRVGEETGRLADLLAYASDRLVKKRGLRSKFVSKLAYPFFLCHAAFLIPAFKTLILVDASTAGRDILFGLLPLYAIIAGIWAVMIWRRHNIALDALLMRLPLLGLLFKATTTVDFCRCLRAELLAGIKPSEAVVIPAGPAAAADLIVARKKIAAGDNLTEALAGCRFLTPTVRGLIAGGEQSGTLPETLERCAQLIDEELDRRINLVAAIAGGVAFAAAAAVIAWQVISFFSEYYGKIESLLPS